MPRGRKFKLSVKKGMKRYANRKRRVVPGYTFGTDLMRAKCECYGTVYMVSGSSNLLWTDSSASSLNFATILGDSTSFTTNVSIYQRYKITGISIRFSPCVAPTVISTSTSQGVCPQACAVIYPNYTGTDLGTLPIQNDRKLLFDTIDVTYKQKFWGFPDNFYDSGGFGLGIWSRTLGYNSQQGQISISQTGTATATANLVVCRYLVTMYVLFADKNG